MRKKIFSFIVSICCCLFSLTGLVGCSDKNNNPQPSAHVHTFHEHWTANKTHHWKIATCEHTTETKDYNTHDFGTDNICDTCNYVQDVVTPLEKEPMSNHFMGVKAVYKKAEFLDENSNKITFNEILDRQFEILAQDILYRLTFVYGENSNGENYRTNSLYNLVNESNNYSYNLNDAVIKNTNLLANSQNQNESLSSVLINSITSYQNSLIIEAGENNILLNTSALYLAGAINGKYTSFVDYENLNFTLSLNAIFSNKWLQEIDTINYSNFSESALKDVFKLKLAQILANNESETNYTTLLNSIDSASFSGFDKTKIASYIYSDIIGQPLVDIDNRYKTDITYKYSGSVNAQTIEAINNNNADFSATYSPRFFKGYSVVVPAIISQALANTFDNTTTSIYSKLNRYTVENTPVATGFNKKMNYSKLILIPKSGTETTKLILNLADVPFMNARVNVYIGETKYSGYTISLASGENEISIESVAKNKTFGSYMGNNANNINDTIFGNPSNVADRGNYIEIIFSNNYNQEFTVTFSGYYDVIK